MKVIEIQAVGKHRLVKVIANSGEEAMALIDRYDCLAFQDKAGIIDALRTHARRNRAEADRGRKWKITKDALERLAYEYIELAKRMERNQL